LPPAHNPTLLSIIGYARSGALDYVWVVFDEGGVDRVDDDPAVISARGGCSMTVRSPPRGAMGRRLYLDATGGYASGCGRRRPISVVMQYLCQRRYTEAGRRPSIFNFSTTEIE